MSVLPPPQEKAQYVRSMFTTIASRYDIMNRLMTFGLDQYWRRFAAQKLHLKGTPYILDIGTGTGDFLPILQNIVPKATIVGLDFTYAMMAASRLRKGKQNPIFVNGDALHLPFPSGICDAITTGFMLRNVVDIRQALRELARVTKPKGKIACLEVARPNHPLLQWGHHHYFHHVVPLLGRLIGKSSQAYTYLPQSAEQFPHPQVLASLMETTGWGHVQWEILGFGAVAVHIATRTD